MHSATKQLKKKTRKYVTITERPLKDNLFVANCTKKNPYSKSHNFPRGKRKEQDPRPVPKFEGPLSAFSSRPLSIRFFPLGGFFWP